MQAAEELAPYVGVSDACRALGVPRATLYRRRRPPRPKHDAERRRPDRALTPEERQDVLTQLHSERFCDAAPAQVVATLLEEDKRYLCSVRTMYRILAGEKEVRERRNQRRHPSYAKPELLATRPNQVWSWDITKLKGPAKWVYYSLYVILDLFSRYVVGWMLAEAERASLAERLIEATCAKQRIQPGQLTIHADRGSPMIAKPVALLLADLGIDKTHSRPHTSNDNPYSEAHFRTLKYRPEMPERFGSAPHGREVIHDLMDWYNNRHHHSGIAYLTPAMVHHGRSQEVLAARHRVRMAAYEAHPERFVNGKPKLENLPSAVWINAPSKTTHEDAPGSTIVGPDDPEVAPNQSVLGPYPKTISSPLALVTSHEPLQ